MKRRSKKVEFLAGYSVHEDYLVSPDKASGRPGLFEGLDPIGRRVLIKYWPRESGNQNAIFEELWRSEIRQLHSLAALPKADDLIVKMVSSGKDSSGYYLVLDLGEGAPLELFRLAKTAPSLLSSVRLPQSRLRIWQNIRRLIEGIDLLHSQGALHRNIDPWSIVTNLGSEPDFRLTGFEWSMRITTATLEKTRRMAAPRVRSTSSFLGDWADLSLLIAQLLEIPSERLGNMNLVPSAVAEHATSAEIRLLRTMLGLLPVDHLDSNELIRQLDAIVISFDAEAAGKDAKLHLALHLGPGSRLTERIRAASNSLIETAEIDRQIDFIASDIGSTPLLVAYKQQNSSELSYLLCGENLNYRIRPYKRPSSLEDESWEFAYSDDAEEERPLPWAVIDSAQLELAELDFFDRRDAYQSFPRLRGKTRSWGDIVERLGVKSKTKTPAEQVHQALALMLLLELAYAASDIFPVSILTPLEDAPYGDAFRIKVESIIDEGRIELSSALNILPPAVRLKRLFESDELREDGAWTLLEAGELGERSTPTTWRLVEEPSQESEGVFTLEGTQPPQTTGRAFLTTSGIAGTITQLRRRLKALSALGKHKELLNVLADPRSRIEDSQDKLDPKDDSLKMLDASKRIALEEIISTVPLFLLQGPPGVGKTFLVSEIVKRRLNEEPTSRILLTAQSNSAIDHLMDEVRVLFPAGDGQPLIVRARSADANRDDGELEVDYQAARILEDLANSKLLSEGTKSLQRRIRELTDDVRSSASKQGRRAKRGGRTTADKRALESMILRAANLVFATTNSAAVETLIDEKGYFDWSIIEEAAKATGSELVSPMMLSYRRLMIGDHKQLPPFDIDKIEDLLSEPANVANAINASEDLISRYLKDVTLDEAIDEAKSAFDDLARTCGEALTLLSLFGTFVEDDFARLKQRPDIRRIARRLDEQHRMHPVIAELVSQSFYDNELKTAPEKAKQFNDEPSPIIFSDESHLRNSPLTFITLPYCRTVISGPDFSDRMPRWANDMEVETSVRLLSTLRASDNLKEKPTLAVLSPYQEQIKGIRRAIADNRAGKLANLDVFAPAISADDYCGTVDSFQGAQADCVVVSLVRNNVHTNPQKALGFLTISSRMNVLLSRAKHKLVLIGSLEFLDYISSNISGDADLSYIIRMLDYVRTSAGERKSSIVQFDKFYPKP